MTTDLTCLYCEKWQREDPEDCNEEGETYEHECIHCEKTFVFTISYSKSFYEERADCLNGAPHNYEKTKTWPEEYAKMRCTMCGDEKPLEVKP